MEAAPAVVEVLCTTPFGLEFIVREEVAAAVGPDAFAGFRDDNASGVVRFGVRCGANGSDVVRAALQRVHALRSVEHVCSYAYSSPDDAYPMTDPKELEAMEAEAALKKDAFTDAARLWAVARGAAFESTNIDALAKEVLFRCTALRFGKGFRTGKPKYKSPDCERKVGAAVHGLFGWRACMLLYTMRVMLFLVDSKVVVGVVLDTADSLKLRPGFSFQTTSRGERDAWSRADVSRTSEERLAKLANTEAVALATRARILAGEPVSIIKEIDRDIVGSLKETLHKNDVRVSKSENSMNIPIAHALLHLSDVRDGDVVVDPMAGSATTLLEASLLPTTPAAVLGGDITSSECTVASLNVDSFQHMASRHGLCKAPTLVEGGAAARGRKRRRLNPADAEDSAAPTAEGERHYTHHHPLSMGVLNWDATRLPMRAGSADVVLTDFPFGNRCVRSVKLYPRVVSEFARILRPGGRCTFLTVQHKPFHNILGSPAMAGIWRVRREPFKVNMGEMYPVIFCLERTEVPWRPECALGSAYTPKEPAAEGGKGNDSGRDRKKGDKGQANDASSAPQ